MTFIRLDTLCHALGRWLRGDATVLTRDEISRTISFARISLIVGLVFLHYQAFPDSDVSPFVGIDLERHPVATFINSFVLFFFFSVVPLLSMVSGWLFFAFKAEGAGVALLKRIRRRLASLYMPLVVWNALFLAVLALLYFNAPEHALLDKLNLRFSGATVADYVNAVFGVTQHPIAFQFWFVRDLFVTMLVSPLLWLSLRHTPYMGMALLGAAWLAGSGLGIFFRTDVAFFFYLGGFIRTRGIELHIGRSAALGFLAGYVVLVALRALAPAMLDLNDGRPLLLTAATRAMRLVGVVACWGIFLQLARTRFGRFVAGYGGLAFFLHAMHFPLIAEVKIRLWQLVPAQTDAWLLVHFLGSVVLTVSLCMAAGLLLARWAPGAFALMNGGRPGLLFGASGKRAAALPVSTRLD